MYWEGDLESQPRPQGHLESGDGLGDEVAVKFICHFFFVTRSFKYVLV